MCCNFSQRPVEEQQQPQQEQEAQLQMEQVSELLPPAFPTECGKVMFSQDHTWGRGGYLPWLGNTYFGRGYLPWQEGLPTLDRGVPTLDGGGVPTLDGAA